MAILKLKIKLNFKIIILFFISSLIYCQGILIESNYKNVYSLSANYSKYQKKDDYNYGVSFASIWNGKTQLNVSYDKYVEYISKTK